MAGQCCGEGEERVEVGGFVFVADGEAAVAEQPCDGSFDDPAVSAEFVVALDAFACDARDDGAVAEPGAEGGDVVGLVGVEFRWSGPAWSASGPDLRDSFDQGFEGVAVVGVRRGDRHGQGYAGAVGQGVDLRSGFAAVDRAGTGQ